MLEGTDGTAQSVKISDFKKAPRAPIEAVLAAVGAASPGPYTVSCAFARVLADDETGAQRFSLVPRKAKVAWDASVNGGDTIDPPCGPLGVQFNGQWASLLLTSSDSSSDRRAAIASRHSRLGTARDKSQPGS